MFKNFALALCIGASFLISLYSDGPNGNITDMVPQRSVGPTGSEGPRGLDRTFMMGATGPTGPTGPGPAVGLSVLKPQPQVRLNRIVALPTSVTSVVAIANVVNVLAFQGDGFITMAFSSGAAWSWEPFTFFQQVTGPNSPVRVGWNGSQILTTFVGTGLSPAVMAIPFSITDEGIVKVVSSPIQVSPNSGSPGGNSITSVVSCTAPVASCGFPKGGFMAVWTSIDSGINNLWSNFSCDGINWNPANATQINQSAMQSVNQNYASVCGNSAVFFAMWQHMNEGWGSFTLDQGRTWTTPTIFFSDMASNSTPTVFATENGFMIVYISNAGVKPTIKSQLFGFISPGMNNTIVPVKIFNGNIPAPNIISDVSLSGTAIGFVASWIASDNNVYACFFPLSTLEWTNIVQVSTGGVADNNGAVGISALADRCLITWNNNEKATYSCYMNFPASNVQPYLRGLNSSKRGLFQ